MSLLLVVAHYLARYWEARRLQFSQVHVLGSHNVIRSMSNAFGVPPWHGIPYHTCHTHHHHYTTCTGTWPQWYLALTAFFAIILFLFVAVACTCTSMLLFLLVLLHDVEGRPFMLLCLRDNVFGSKVDNIAFSRDPSPACTNSVLVWQSSTSGIIRWSPLPAPAASAVMPFERCFLFDLLMAAAEFQDIYQNA